MTENLSTRCRHDAQTTIDYSMSVFTHVTFDCFKTSLTYLYLP